ncbi:MAG: hypothetical protein A2231_11375 [Candidatus Firestonebacteria bacterium RIFOXYA2_FULL_40_8]|nr:MAG: hypothetical protein A2231_11375 [Candidatus Firestonebacteria bacterium RIFOXYA2_FULL_40_8]
MSEKKRKVFLIIPDNSYGYRIQRERLERIVHAAGCLPVTLDRSVSAEILWKQLVDGLSKSHLFIGDITYHRPNVPLEVGIVLGLSEKESNKRKDILLVNAPFDEGSIPSDLLGLRIERYSTILELESHVIKWLSDRLNKVIEYKQESECVFEERFFNHNKFHKEWSVPRFVNVSLTSDGLLINGGWLPVSTKHLLFSKYEMNVTFRLENRNIGVCFNVPPGNSSVKSRFLMLNMQRTDDGNKWQIVPHLYDFGDMHDRIITSGGSWGFNAGYWVYDPNNGHQNYILSENQRWTELLFKVNGSKISVYDKNNSNSLIYEIDYDVISEGQFIIPKSGGVGFRCSGYSEIPGGEAATIRGVIVNQLA